MEKKSFIYFLPRTRFGAQIRAAAKAWQSAHKESMR
jgi:branched-subunit amino acid ABC-type transport system permease component